MPARQPSKWYIIKLNNFLKASYELLLLSWHLFFVHHMLQEQTRRVLQAFARPA